MLSCIRLFATSWTVAHQAPLPMEFSRQEWKEWQEFLLQGIFPTKGLNRVPCVSFFITSATWEAPPPQNILLECEELARKKSNASSLLKNS